MSRAIDRHRERQASHGVDHAMDSVEGEESSASAYGNLAAGAVKGIAEIVQTEQAKKSAEKKTAQDKEDARQKDNKVKDLESNIKGLQSEVDSKNVAAQIADMKAQVEKEPGGPLHQIAMQAHASAAVAQRELQSAQQALATLKGGGQLTPEQQMQLMQMQQRGSSGVPTWAWWAGGTVGAGGVVYLIYRLFRGKRRG